MQPPTMNRTMLDGPILAVTDKPVIEAISGPQAARESAAPPGYKPQLDGLRLLAFATVFLHHALPQNPQNLPAHLRNVYQLVIPLRDTCGFGLCIFFCLSSYLITDLLLSEKRKTGGINLPWFYTRRVLRIWPLYLAILVGCAVFFRNDPQMAISGGRLLAMLFFVGNWYAGKYGFGNNPVGPLWSISLEEQFYLLWPCIVKFTAPKVLRLLSLIIAAFSLVAVWFFRAGGLNLESGIWTNTFVQFGFFAAGSYLALTLRPARLPKNSGLVVIAGGLAAFLLAAAVCHVKNDSANASASTVCLGYALLMVGTGAILAGSLALSPSLFPKPILFLGKISYGLYVFHALLLYIASLCFAKGPLALVEARLAALIATIGIASLSYLYFELPFLRLKDRFAYIKTRQT